MNERNQNEVKEQIKDIPSPPIPNEEKRDEFDDIYIDYGGEG